MLFDAFQSNSIDVPNNSIDVRQTPLVLLCALHKQMSTSMLVYASQTLSIYVPSNSIDGRKTLMVFILFSIDVRTTAVVLVSFP